MTIIESESNALPSRPATLDDRKASAPTLAPTWQLLTEGGDARIVLDAVSGLNKYGCSTYPDPGLVALGSSTASIISPEGFAAADQLRTRLQNARSTESDAVLYANEMNRIRRELLRQCGVSEGAGVDIVFAASGTDIHLIAAQALGTGESQSPLVIMVDPNETGSGVAAALAGRHFSSCSALGETVSSGAVIRDAAAIEVVNVPLRNADGVARPAEDIDADFEKLASQAATEGRHVLLILIDGSKTGTIAPTTACALKLQQQFAGRIDVLVDACQFRIAPSTMRAYFQRDFMVAVTGSKFVTGPTFSGALFIPPVCARRLRRHPIPAALRAYSSRADWPQDWETASALEPIANFGVLLRWEAALRELQAFRAVPESQVTAFITAFGNAVQKKLQDLELLEPLPLPSLDRLPLTSASSWDHIPTIHPFLLHRPDGVNGKTVLNREQTQRVYQLLHTDLTTHPDFGVGKFDNRLAGLRCQLGQPVNCGERDGVAVSVLRICASMRQVVQATANDGRAAAAIIEKAVLALEKAALLAKVTT
ncbi:MAG: hypothetical protein JO269_06935 [Burkholderiaceae bacterium]|nr:hypothetical protein [Burkholderiaceae bacterium]